MMVLLTPLLKSSGRLDPMSDTSEKQMAEYPPLAILDSGMRAGTLLPFKTPMMFGFPKNSNRK